MTAPRLAWGLCVVGLLLVPTGPGLLYLINHDSKLYSAAFAGIQVFTCLVGAVVVSRLPRNAVGWILLGMGVSLSVGNSLSAYGTLGTTTSHGPLPLDNLSAWAGSWTFLPIVFGGVIFLLYLFPDGQFMSATWHRLAQASVVVLIAATVVEALNPGPMDDASGIDNPVGATGWLADAVRTGRAITDPLALPALGFAAAALVVRFRRSRGVERQQLKWISFAFVMVGVGLGLTASVPVADKVTFFFGLFALAGVPLAIGAAMLRYRLYDIDVVINRTLVYGALTATLAGTYLGSVLLLQLVLSRFTQGSSLAIAVSTLGVAGLFGPARAGIQHAVDRRFFRSKYDAGKTLERFAIRVRGQAGLGDVAGDLLAVVHETVQPSHVSLWVRSGGSS
ncbi:MAG: hypothetical protein ACJ72L_03225 [Marmoricola sp.]